MGIFTGALNFFLHLDKHLGAVIQQYGFWTYSLLFLVIFCETGLVVTPFLPGDSLLFAAGAFAAVGSLNVILLFFLLTIAAIAGDTLNYSIGRFLGPRIFQYENSRWLKKKHLDRTHHFFEKYGGKTIIIARFIPIVRTFAPFVAGVGGMGYGSFLSFNVVGGVVWIALFTFSGYYFGNIPIVKNNFSFAILVIILISLLPAVIETVRHMRAKSSNQTTLTYEE